MNDEKFECKILSWQLFYNLSKKVAGKIIDSNYRADIMVGLARGGWVLSRVLCDFLEIKDLVSLKVEHWGVTATPNGNAKIKYPFKIDLSGKKVIVVDDITDTGQSMKVATDYIRTLNPDELKTATLMHIEGSDFTPDYYGDKVPWKWYIFPWNYTEDMCNIVPQIAAKAGTPSEINEMLKEYHGIKLEEDEIIRILNEVDRRESR